ncbi:hypothetical protein ACFWGM_11305 [Streptomyces roseolus]|uniref:hypothetical protein n=1 Tax=Streptomyces roseolus TaxID=67358 RepID=UPI00363345EF
MATLITWKFSTPDGAVQVQEALLFLQEQGLVQVHDAAVVTWPGVRGGGRGG